MDNWKLAILRELRLRNQRESGGFSELITSHGNLQKQLDALRKEITRLEYENNELDKKYEAVLTEGSSSGGGGAGGGAKVNSRRMEELQAKLMQKTEDLMEMHKKQSGAQGKVAELTEQLRKKEEEISKRDERIRDLTMFQKKAEEKMGRMEKDLNSRQQTNQALIDEHHALQLAFNSQEKKQRELEAENDRLRKHLMAYKARDADQLNDDNEKFRKQRERQLEKEIHQATQDKDVMIKKGAERRDSRKGSNSTSVMDDTPASPSICPSTVLEALDAHENEVSALCFNSQGNYVATGGADKVVKVWSWRESQEKLEPKCTLYGSNASIMSVQFDHNSKMVLAASNDYATRIWNIHDQRPRHTLTGHSNKVMAAKFLEDSQKVVTGSHDRTLKIWDLHHKTCSKTLFAGSSCNDVVTVRGMGSVIISAHFDKRIRFWDLRSATSNEIALQGKVTSLDIFPDQHLLLCCSRDDTLRLIDLRQNSITATYSAGGFHVGVDWTRAAFSPDGQYVAAGSSDGTLFVWETFSGGGTKVKTKKEHSKEVVACAWHPKGQLFASADRNKKVILWRR